MVSTVQLVKPGWRFGRCFEMNPLALHALDQLCFSCAVTQKGVSSHPSQFKGIKGSFPYCFRCQRNLDGGVLSWALFSNPGSSLCTPVLCLLSGCQVRSRLMRGHLARQGGLLGECCAMPNITVFMLEILESQ